MPPSVSVVIPTWNQRALVLECVASVYRQTFTDHEIIVVDDGSTDETVQAIAERFPRARVISLSENKGFACAANVGLNQATASLIFLLNNDMVLAPDCLEKLVDASRRCADHVSMFAPLILFPNGARIYAAGDTFTLGFRPISIGHGVALTDFREPRDIFGVCAGAALYRKTLFERVGYFDESFIAYFEDADLSFRARLARFSAVCVPEARAYHEGSASLVGRHLWRARQCCRNHFQLVIKNIPFSLLVRYAPWILNERVHQLRRVFTLARCERGTRFAVSALLRHVVSEMVLIPRMLRERAVVARSRAVSARELHSLLKKTWATTTNPPRDQVETGD